MANNKSIDLEKHLLKLAKALSSLKQKGIIDSYGLIGGLAIAAIGLPRATKDIDFLVSADNVQKLFSQLKKHFNNKHYTFELKRPEGNVFPYYVILCHYLHNKESLRIYDILISTTNWQSEICDYNVPVKYNRQTIPVIKTEGLIILKLKGGGVMDIIDVENILKVTNSNKLDKCLLKNWAKRAGINRLLSKTIKL